MTDADARDTGRDPAGVPSDAGPGGRRARWLGLSLLGLAAALTIDVSQVASAASAATVARSATVAPVNGETIGSDPTLRPGTQIMLAVNAFGPSALATVEVVGDPKTTSVHRADPRGRVSWVFTVPTDLSPGRHLLTIVGPGPQYLGSAARSGTLVASVPRAARFPFLVAAPRS